MLWNDSKLIAKLVCVACGKPIGMKNAESNEVILMDLEHGQFPQCYGAYMGSYIFHNWKCLKKILKMNPENILSLHKQIRNYRDEAERTEKKEDAKDET